MDHLKLGYETVLNCTLTQLLTSAVLILPTLLVLKVLVSSLFSQDERPVTFDVPLPRELSPEWRGVAWEDISKESREILTSQSTTGVSHSHLFD